jgi:hypothetical protein
MATNLRVTDTELHLSEDGVASVSCNIAWENAWRNDKNHDAGWFFLSIRSPGRSRWDPVPIGGPGFVVDPVAGPEPFVFVPPGAAGFFLEVSGDSATRWCCRTTRSSR